MLFLLWGTALSSAALARRATVGSERSLASSTPMLIPSDTLYPCSECSAPPRANDPPVTALGPVDIAIARRVAAKKGSRQGAKRRQWSFPCQVLQRGMGLLFAQPAGPELF